MKTFQISSYTKYLPSVLWSPESDPSQFLGRLLCIFEQLLTGISIEPKQAALVSATNDSIKVTSVADASQFYPGEIIIIEAFKCVEEKNELVRVTEQVQVKSVRETEIFLVTDLKDRYSEGTVRTTDYASLEKNIDNLSDIFNPWRTPVKFLPWLASWLALNWREEWSEYQKRKFISEMISIYQQRGLKQGLLTYLDIYAATAAKPWIAIDDGEAVFRVKFAEDGTAQLYAIAYSHAVSDSLAFLLHPTAIAVDRNNNYIIVDEGGKERDKTWFPALWKISSTGESAYRDQNGVSQPIYSANLDQRFRNPTAVVVDVVDAPEQYYVLTKGEANPLYNPAIHHFTTSTTTTSLTPTLLNLQNIIDPVDMILVRSANPSSKRFLVLDRGNSVARQKPKIAVINASDGSVLGQYQLSNVIEPTAFAMDATTGRLVVADARDIPYDPGNPNESNSPAELIVIDTKNDWTQINNWSQKPLKIENNPLIFPTSLVFENPQVLFVSDRGVRSEVDDRSNRVIAELATIYQVILSANDNEQQKILPVTDEKNLIHPTKIAIDRKGQLVLTDRGAAYEIKNHEREWRARPNEFGVVVLFSQQRPTTNEQRDKIRFEIANVVNEQKPGHTSYLLKSL